MRQRAALACPGLVAALLAGCTVGPDFQVPPPPTAASYRAGGDQERAAAPQLAAGEAVAFDWWRTFGSPALDALETRAISRNPQVEAAQQRLRAAQAELRAGYGASYPAIAASFDADRQQYSPSRLGATGAGSVFSLFTPSIAISYALDLFGGNRRTVEGLRARAEQQQQDERATYLTLTATVASTAIARAAYHDQAKSLAAQDSAYGAQVQIAEARVRAGLAPYAAVLALRAQREAIQAALATVRQKAEQADNLLASLTGDTPATAALPALAVADFHLPERLPLSLPATVVGQRPDILAAAAAAHAANADVGVARAAMLPNITLTAALGSSANSLGSLFGAGTGVWNYGAAASQPLFAAGALRNRHRAAQALAQAAAADYRQTVLSAFAQIADVLAALQHDGDALAAQARAEADAQTALHLVEVNRASGTAGDADVELGRAQHEQARANAIAATALQLQDCVALFAALGGGWWQ